MHKYSNLPEVKYGFGFVKKSNLPLKNPVYIFNISNIGWEEIYSLSTATFPSLYKNASVALTQDWPPGWKAPSPLTAFQPKINVAKRISNGCLENTAAKRICWLVSEAEEGGQTKGNVEFPQQGGSIRSL